MHLMRSLGMAEDSMGQMAHNLAMGGDVGRFRQSTPREYQDFQSDRMNAHSRSVRGAGRPNPLLTAILLASLVGGVGGGGYLLARKLMGGDEEPDETP